MSVDKPRTDLLGVATQGNPAKAAMYLRNGSMSPMKERMVEAVRRPRKSVPVKPCSIDRLDHPLSLLQ